MRNEIIEHLHREPFIPFRLVLTSGLGYDVTNPDLIALGESVLHLLFPRSDRYAILRLNQLASIESIEPPKEGRRGGSRKKSS
jgi:hypothetical protein